MVLIAKNMIIQLVNTSSSLRVKINYQYVIAFLYNAGLLILSIYHNINIEVDGFCRESLLYVTRREVIHRSQAITSGFQQFHQCQTQFTSASSP